MSKKHKDHQDDTPTIIVNTYPSPKQQVTSTAIQLGIALAIPVVIGAGVAVASGVASAVGKVKARRSGEPFPASTDELPDLESV